MAVQIQPAALDRMPVADLLLACGYGRRGNGGAVPHGVQSARGELVLRQRVLPGIPGKFQTVDLDLADCTRAGSAPCGGILWRGAGGSGDGTSCTGRDCLRAVCAVGILAPVQFPADMLL